LKTLSKQQLEQIKVAAQQQQHYQQQQQQQQSEPQLTSLERLNRLLNANKLKEAFELVYYNLKFMILWGSSTFL